ncbi:hypothetical protein [Roseobacter litoralis]|uniref:hypothetical protein n=1 Tax=Roseobacter litoralis TaxID=42443 RepID=UPI001391725D|nr:hypothetical protein [Roseobacter litoralis]
MEQNDGQNGDGAKTINIGAILQNVQLSLNRVGFQLPVPRATPIKLKSVMKKQSSWDAPQRWSIPGGLDVRFSTDHHPLGENCLML